MNLKARIILFYGILLLPMGFSVSEMYGRANNIGYGFFYIAFVIMVWFFFAEHDTWKKIFNYFILILCSVTNPVSYIILAIVLLFDFFKNVFKKPKNIKNIIAPILAGAISLVSLGMMAAITVSDLIQKDAEFDTTKIIEFFFRSWIYPFVWPFYSYFNDFKAIISMIAFITICIYFVFVAGKANRKLLFVSYLTLIGYTLITLLSRKSLTKVLLGYLRSWPDRYFYVQNILVVFIFCTFVSAVGSMNDGVIKNRLKTLVSFLLIYSVILLSINANIIFEFTENKLVETSRTLEDEIYRAYYEQGESEDYLVSCPPFLPEGLWQAKFPKEYILASVADNIDDYYEFVSQLSDESG
ncbi:MAG: hypothetical protein GX928_02600 [Ruminococcaceae bacterium]|nr:hypothetical protein [Oscillospiraceae bacterium]